MKKYADFHKGDTPSFKIGDKAWLEASHYSMNRPSKKLSHKWLGPFPIVEIMSSNAIKLKLPSRLRIHLVFNVSDLRPYVPPSFPGQTVKPPEPVIIDGEMSYEIDEMLDSKFERSKLLYLVKWKGYSTEHNSWEPESNILPHREKSLKKFHWSHPAAPRRITKLSFDSLEFTYRMLTEPIDKSLPDKISLAHSLRSHPENES